MAAPKRPPGGTEALIVEVLRSQGPMGKKQLAYAVGLSSPTSVTRILGRLQSQGRVRHGFCVVEPEEA